MYKFIAMVGIIVCLYAYSSAAITYNIRLKNGAQQVSEKAIELLIRDALNLDKSTIPYYRSTVNAYFFKDGAANYLVVYLYRLDCYSVSVYRLDLKDSQVVAITPDYIEESTDKEPCGTCPDPTVEALFSYINDASFPGATVHGWKAYADALAAGVKSVILIGFAETKTAVTNYLTCPKLKVWGRIGHGSVNQIQLSDNSSSFTTSDISKLASYIKGKTFIFNSCHCHNPPFETAMLSAGAYFFAGGNIALSGGNTNREVVYSEFFKKAIAGKMELTKAMDQAVAENNYPNAWGYSGAGPAPYYLFAPTALSNYPSVKTGDFSMRVTQGKIFFTVTTVSSESLFRVFNPIGMLVYRNSVSPESNTWDLTTSGGQKIPAGHYIAVFTDGTNSIGKQFSIVK
jgi:hypothetical protein